jgi:hypothetical protein
VKKKQYIKPKINKVALDFTISLQMLSGPIDPPPRGSGSKGTGKDTPFGSPFGDKPFS